MISLGCNCEFAAEKLYCHVFMFCIVKNYKYSATFIFSRLFKNTDAIKKQNKILYSLLCKDVSK